jgi:hypothetical protein
MYVDEQIIQSIVQSGFESDIFVKSGLVDIHVKLRCMEYAWRVFDKIPLCNVISCTAMLRGFAMDEPG